MNLNSIMIGSEDPTALAGYYTALRQARWDEGGYTGWQIGTGGLMIGPHDKVHGLQRRAGPDHLEHRDRRCEGRLRPDEGGRRDGGPEPYRPDGTPGGSRRSPIPTATTSSSPARWTER